MKLHINPNNEARVRAAVMRRGQLLRMYTADMPDNYEEELIELDRIIASAVSVGINQHIPVPNNTGQLSLTL